MGLVKPYLKKVTTYLNENDKADRVDGFKKGATEMIKFIIGIFDEVQIYAGSK